MIDLEGKLDRIMNSDANQTFDRTTDSLEAIRNFIAGQGGASGISFYGVVTDVPGANQFTCPELAGLGDDKFLDLAGRPFHAYVYYDAGGAAAAPQGENRAITDYVSATGTFTTAAFSAPVAVGDQILIMHPFLVPYILDNVTEAVGPYSYLDAGGEQTVYANTGTTRRRISFEMDLNTMTQNGTIRIYRKVDGTNYRLWLEEAFAVGGNEKVFTRGDMVTNQDLQITYQESVNEGANRSIPYNVIIEALE